MRHPAQDRDSQSQSTRSLSFSRGRGLLLWRTMSCWRSARFSANRLALLAETARTTAQNSRRRKSALPLLTGVDAGVNFARHGCRNSGG